MKSVKNFQFQSLISISLNEIEKIVYLPQKQENINVLMWANSLLTLDKEYYSHAAGRLEVLKNSKCISCLVNEYFSFFAKQTRIVYL